MGDILKKAVNISGIVLTILFAFLIILKSNVCIKSALSGLLICGNIIIPTIYPFTFCVLFIKNSGVFKILKPFNSIILKLFGLNFYEFAIFLMSLIGGYPIGAKLLSDSKIKKTPIMINYCINAGPAFIILAVGKGVFKSINIGWILFFSHIFSSVVIAFFHRFKLKSELTPTPEKPINAVDNFVISASAAAETVIKICSIVIIFSVIGGYIELFSKQFNQLYYLGLLCEVTNAVFKCNNVITVSFLLGFSGFGIWAQVFGILKSDRINYIKFIAFRLVHGGLSASFTLLLLKIFKITVNTLSNGIKFNYTLFTNGPVVAFSLIITGIVLIISLYNKKFTGNLVEDIV